MDSILQLDSILVAFSQHFTVEYVFDEEVERLVVEVFDVQGRLLVTEGQQNVQAGKFNLDLSCCAEGTYICRVIADGAVVETQRIVHSK